MNDLLLVGAGHAHLHVITHAAALTALGYRVRLLAPREFLYSGVASATSAGTLEPDVGRIDVRGLAERSGIDFHEGTLEAVDLRKRSVQTSEGAQLSYDVLSLNIGSVVAPAGMVIDPAVVRVKPLSGLGELRRRIAQSHREAPARVTVVGAGFSGLELAAHLATHPLVAAVTLIDAGSVIGADLPAGARRRIHKLLHARGVRVTTGCQVEEVGARRLRCSDGTEIPHDTALLATGLVAPPAISETGLGDERGVPVRSTLQHVDRDEVYAVGDCARFLPERLPLIGVHGVRQGPVLHASLVARMTGKPLPDYLPPQRTLSILDLGDGVGLAVLGRWWWYGTGPLRLKRWIDRRWLGKYRSDH